MAGKRVAVLSTAFLTELLGETVEVRRSGRENSKYPLYLSTKTGPMPFNTAAGQDFLLERAVFDGANVPEPTPNPNPNPNPNPEPNPEPTQEKPKRRRGFFSEDEGLGI